MSATNSGFLQLVSARRQVDQVVGLRECHALALPQGLLVGAFLLGMGTQISRLSEARVCLIDA
jgi:hypothetical protein